jgi:hypothetical protein
MQPGIRRIARVLLVLLALSVISPAALSQDQSSGAPAPPYSAAEIEQLVAPIALYPDSLLGPVLMASTYPLEVVEAERWVQDPANGALQGDALASALETIDWDPSVKALVPFPAVLQMMSGNLEWMQKLGDAFLAQQADVMDGVQRLRAQAASAGNLNSTPQQTVTVEDGEITIAPASPDVLYVPAYDPFVVYGMWPYPDYLPYYLAPPPGYYYAPAYSGIVFSVGFVIVPNYWGWNHCDWRHHRIAVDAHRVNAINRYPIKHYHQPPFEGRYWTHEPVHRVGVPYRSPQVRQRYERRLPGSPQFRYEYRGHEHAPQPVRVIPPGQPPVRVHPPNQPPVRVIPPGQPPMRVVPAPAVTPRPIGPVPHAAPQYFERQPAPIYQRSRSGTESREYSNRGRESRQSTPAHTAPSGAPSHGGGGQRGGGSYRR